MMLVRSSCVADTSAAWLSACACMFSHQSPYSISRAAKSPVADRAELPIALFHQSCWRTFDQHTRPVVAHFKDLGRGRRTSFPSRSFRSTTIFIILHPMTRRSRRCLIADAHPHTALSQSVGRPSAGDCLGGWVPEPLLSPGS